MWMSSPTTAASTQPANSAANEEVRKLMEELGSVRITAGQRRAGVQTEPVVEAATSAEVKSPAQTQPASQPTSRPAPHPRAPVEPLPKELLARLKELSSTALAAPATLGDELYAGGHLQAAYVLYEHAAKNGDPNSKPWALLQMADCVRASDPAAAEQLYAQVVRDHANTVWASAAEAESRTLAWLRASNTADVLQAAERSTAAATKAASRTSTKPAPASAPSKAPAGSQVPGLPDGKSSNASSGNKEGRAHG
jgi:hypothetical protein